MRKHITAIALSLLALPAVAFAADDYKVDTVHSAVVFHAVHFGVGHTYGRFNDFEGTFVVDNGAPTSIDITVKAESVDTNVEKRDKHLASPDYLNAGEFPEIHFVSKKITPAGEGKWTAEGDLTFHGTTKPITVTLNKVGEGKDAWGGYRYGFETSFQVKRSDFGLPEQDGVSDEINLIVALEGTKKKL